MSDLDGLSASSFLYVIVLRSDPGRASESLFRLLALEVDEDPAGLSRLSLSRAPPLSRSRASSVFFLSVVFDTSRLPDFSALVFDTLREDFSSWKIVF